jgi:predicted RNase H-like HicB family nuclease
VAKAWLLGPGPWSGIVAGRIVNMKHFTAVIERDADTGLYVAWVPGFPGAHSQGETLDELRSNLREVIEMLLEDGEPRLESEFVGTQTVEVA